MAAAWQEAAADLGVGYEAGGTLAASNGGSYAYVGVLPDFGGPRGTMIFADDADLWTRGRAVEELGYRWSVLSDSYERYDRTLFADTLDDWGWSGEGDPPAWYTGKPWSS